MKKIGLIAFCIFSLVAHAAESNKTVMCLAGNTLFLISKNDICRHGRALDVMVVGKTAMPCSFVVAVAAIFALSLEACNEQTAPANACRCTSVTDTRKLGAPVWDC